MIVTNTLTGSVSEYSIDFQSLSGDLAGDHTGLFQYGGDKDGTALVIAEIRTGRTQLGDSVKKHPELVYFGIQGTGEGELIIETPTTEYRYPVIVREAGESRGKPGLGIRENYLAIGYSNADGEDFKLDRMEVLIASPKTRRV